MKASGRGALGQAPMRDSEQLYGYGLRLIEYADCASGTSIQIKIRSSNSGLDFKLPDC